MDLPETVLIWRGQPDEFVVSGPKAMWRSTLAFTLSNILPAYLRNPDAFIISAPKVNEVATPLASPVDGLT